MTTLDGQVFQRGRPNGLIKPTYLTGVGLEPTNRVFQIPHGHMRSSHDMRILHLTNNPNLGSTSRILQSWLLLGRENGVKGIVGAQKDGAFAKWLRENSIDCQ